MGRKTKMNSITSPELLSIVNKENMSLLEGFLDYLGSIGRSEGTIAQYRNDIQISFVWCYLHNSNKFFVDWTKRNIISYQKWLLEKNENSPARVRRLKASLSSMSNYIENILDDEYPNFRNIINKIENPKNIPVREKTIWSNEELEILLQTLTGRYQYEKACFVALGMYGGRRKSEILRFKISDFADDRLVCSGALYKSSPVLTKGEKYLECYTLAKQFKPYLDLWLKDMKSKNIESVWLFPDKLNPSEHMKPSSVNSWTKTFSRITGKDFYPHSLRHYYVSALARAGIPDSIIVDIIGWSSSEMFKIYNDNPKDEQLGMYFSENGIVAPERKSFSEIQ